MTPAEQYRTLVNRLTAIAESNPTPPAVPSPHAPDPAQQAQVNLPAFKARCLTIINKLAEHVDVWDQQIVPYVDVIVTNDPEDDIYSMARYWEITIDYGQWNDAPDNVLTFALAHEVGHIVKNHRGKSTAPTAQAQQQQELDADTYASKLCIAMGLTKAPVFKWMHDKRDALLHQQTLDFHRDPANADYFKNQATHPTLDHRFDNAAQQGFELSKADTGQLDRMLAHMTKMA